ncbi:MAG TPA: tRNA pseudouridine(38-40) synthase TruA [Halanaerobiales bacterium]|nr:tRNA pseudouridine(38-40) synthase TruA [Halanaerobiales bacterium]
MRNIKIILEYDGTNYQGWQYQKHTNKTIQQTLEIKLTKLNKSKVPVIGAGRTDSGAHAKGQAANFYIDVDIPVSKIPIALNSMLPADIVCKDAKHVANDFHARYDSVAKKYRYRLLNRSFHSVFTRNYVYTLYKKLDLKKIKYALKDFIGKYDFAAFQSSGSDVGTTKREIKSFEMKFVGEEIWFDIVGTGFLYNMVRIIIGTLIEIGLNKRPADDVKRIIKSQDRIEAGFTAPAKGLSLLKVYY